MNRADAHRKFLNDHGWGKAGVTALPSDASFRQYHRLQDGARRALLMEAPPDKENIHAYVIIARHLVALGLSAPKILALDEAAGLAVIEDFGEDTYTRLLDGGADPVALYELAVDVLIALHGCDDAASVDAPAYDHNRLLDEAALLVDWYLPAMTGASTPDAVRQSWLDAWQTVFEGASSLASTLVLRDYHVDNLMVLKERSGAARAGLLDFQDAVIGHPAYDLVSLLEDARRDVSDALTQAMQDRYRAALPSLADETLGPWYAILGVQRHAKIAGIFVRLCVRDGKPIYMPHIPRVMGLLARRLDAPELAPVKAWFDEHLPHVTQSLPPLDPAVVRRLVSV
ncbi:MAG: phosphotransferase [Alphaproteobacteria bacterium]|nr:phosphotransferase [Alphaproteobacteria bacterium]